MTETDDEDDVILEKETRGAKENRPTYHPFVPHHALVPFPLHNLQF
jgi:hypothetical protein